MLPPGGIIMFGALLLFEDEFIHVVSISFTALIITELLMVALTIRTFHWLMGVSIAVSFLIYVVTLFFFKDYFGKGGLSYALSVSSQESYDHDGDTSLLLTLRLFGDDHARIVETETKTAQYVLEVL